MEKDPMEEASKLVRPFDTKVDIVATGLSRVGVQSSCLFPDVGAQTNAWCLF